MKGPQTVKISFSESPFGNGRMGNLHLKFLPPQYDDSIVIQCRVSIGPERFHSILVLDLRSVWKGRWTAFCDGMKELMAGRRRRVVYRQDESLTLMLLHKDDQFWLALDSHHYWKLHPVLVASEEMWLMRDFFLRLTDYYDKRAFRYQAARRNDEEKKGSELKTAVTRWRAKWDLENGSAGNSHQ